MNIFKKIFDFFCGDWRIFWGIALTVALVELAKSWAVPALVPGYCHFFAWYFAEFGIFFETRNHKVIVRFQAVRVLGSSALLRMMSFQNC
jgi:hypothetical protein